MGEALSLTLSNHGDTESTEKAKTKRPAYFGSIISVFSVLSVSPWFIRLSEELK